MLRFDILLVFSAFLSLLLLGAAVRGRLPGPKAGGVSVIPGIAGLAVLIFLVVTFRGQIPAVLGQVTGGARSLVLTVAVAVIAGAVAHFLFSWCLEAPRALISTVRRPKGDGARPWPWLESVTLAVGSMALAGGVIGVLYLESRPEQTGEVRSSIAGLVAGVYALPGGPTDVVFLDDRSGYVSVNIDFLEPDERSEILRFELPDGAGGEFRFETVADGLTHPRGMALLNDTLYVSDQGTLPCVGVPFQRCIRGLDPDDGEPNSIRVTRGKVLAYEVLPGGALGPSRVVLDDLPISNFEHALGGVEAHGGRIYVSVGGPAQLARTPELLAAVDRPNIDLLGTIVSVLPDGSDVEIHARGIRNIFQFTFDDRGNMFGVENDGPSARGWKFAEVLQLDRGDDFGFPSGGTLDSWGNVNARPLWILPRVGTAGIEWAGRVGLGPGLLLGSDGRIEHMTLTLDEQGYHVRDKTDVRELVSITAGYVSMLTAGPRPGQLMAGVFGSSPNKLILLDFGRANPASLLSLTCAGCHGTRFEGMPGLGPDLTRSGSMGSWTEEQFVAALRAGLTPDGRLLDAQRMPWLQFAELPDEDLIGLWNYLRSLPAASPGGDFR